MEKTTLIHELQVIRSAVKDVRMRMRMLPKEARQIFPETMKLLRIAPLRSNVNCHGREVLFHIEEAQDLAQDPHDPG